MARRVNGKSWDLLAREALAARKQAYAPYSRFKVGAALLTESGLRFSGCNVENAAFGLCLCAERNAITTAVAAGERDFIALAVATNSTPPAPPCGQCLQFMAEFCLDLPILLVNHKMEGERTRLSRLMAKPFRWKGVKP